MNVPGSLEGSPGVFGSLWESPWEWGWGLAGEFAARPHTLKNQDIHRSAKNHDFNGFIEAGAAFLSVPGSLEGSPGVSGSLGLGAGGGVRGPPPHP